MNIDGVDSTYAARAPSAVSRDVLHSVDEANFRQQMERFESMRQTQAEFRAARRAVPEAPVASPDHPFVPRVFNREELAAHPHALLLDRAQHVLLGLRMKSR